MRDPQPRLTNYKGTISSVLIKDDKAFIIFDDGNTICLEKNGLIKQLANAQLEASTRNIKELKDNISSRLSSNLQLNHSESNDYIGMVTVGNNPVGFNSIGRLNIRLHSGHTYKYNYKGTVMSEDAFIVLDEHGAFDYAIPAYHCIHNMEYKDDKNN